MFFKKQKTLKKEIADRSLVSLSTVPVYKSYDDEADRLCDLGATAYSEGRKKEALEYYFQACALGDSRGLLFAAIGMFEGGSTERAREGFELFLEGAKDLTDKLYPFFYGTAGTTFGLGEEDDPYVDYNLSLELLNMGAEVGDPTSCYYLGKLYDGEKQENFLVDYPTIEEDEEKARFYFEKCAAYYPRVFDCPESPELLEARRLDVPAMVVEALVFSIAEHYFSDDEADRRKAFNYAKLYEKTGIPEAKILLAKCYAGGVGVTGNIKYALQLLKEAIAAGAEPNKLYYDLKDEIADRIGHLKELYQSSKEMNSVDLYALHEALKEIEQNMQRKREEEEKKEKIGRVEQAYLGSYYFYEDGKGYGNGIRLRRFDPETGRGETEDGRKVKGKYDIG